MMIRNFVLALGIAAVTTWPLAAEKWVRLEGGGYTSGAETIVAQARPQAPARVVETARSFEGLPYVWAGTSPTRGFDCSGFVHEVMRLNGYQVPRMAHHQYEQSRRVEREHLVPGDMVFFETYTEGPSHVGFYLGEDNFIHASSSGRGVIVSSLNSPYYSSRFIGGGRPDGWLGSEETAAAEDDLLEPDHRLIVAETNVGPLTQEAAPLPKPTPILSKD